MYMRCVYVLHVTQQIPYMDAALLLITIPSFHPAIWRSQASILGFSWSTVRDPWMQVCVYVYVCVRVYD